MILFMFNYGVYRLISLIVGPLLSISLIIAFYYTNARKLVRGIAFPGTTIIMKRQLETDFCRSMAQGVLRSVVDMKNCIEIFMGPIPQHDYERTEILNLACQKTMSMIVSLEHQVEA